MNQEDKTPKGRILETAIALFAKRGYDAVGVREIAEKADVNISMISYYFNGKIGILTAIFDKFHNQYHETIVDAIDDNQSPEDCIQSIIYNIIDFVKDNIDLALVAYNALPLDIPEIAGLKVSRVHRLIQTISGLALRLGVDPDDWVLISIVGSSLLSIILTHFRLRPIQKEVLNIEFNDAYYDRYKHIISTLFLYGVTGMSRGMKHRQ